MESVVDDFIDSSMQPNAAIRLDPAMSNFPDYAAPLTETILLGNLAVWCSQRIEWDAEKMEATNAIEGIDSLIHPEYRDGWSIE